LIEHRRRVVDKRTAVKNALRAQLRALGIKAPPRRSLWSVRGLEWLKGQVLPTRLDEIKRAGLLAELATLDTQVDIVEAELDRIGKNDWRVILLRTIPGVGPRTAEAVSAYIDRPERFGRIKAIGKYFGVIPCQDQSAGKNRLGHITREGPATVRKLITEAAWRSVRCSPLMRAFYDKVVGGQKQRKAIGLVAAAHKLLRIMLAMLRSREAWREESLAPASGAVLPAAATANCIETPRPAVAAAGRTRPR
jgi:transposase